MLSHGAFTYTYDEQGNMLTESDGANTNSGTKTYSYDAKNKLAGFDDGTQSKSVIPPAIIRELGFKVKDSKL